MFCCAQQIFQVKWDNVLSAPFNVCNDVWQGGILSLILVNVYRDDSSTQLNNGCLVDSTIADDLVLLCPCSAGLQQLVKACCHYGFDYDIKYNASKSHIIRFRIVRERKSTFPTISDEQVLFN